VLIEILSFKLTLIVHKVDTASDAENDAAPAPHTDFITWQA
jgi:hypothetical protein